MVYKRPPFTPAAAGFGSAAAETLSGEGLDVVRLGVIYSAVEPQPGHFDSSYLDSIETTVSTLASHGVYTLLDFHQDEMSQEFGGEGFPTWSVQTNGLPVKPYIFPLAYTQSQALDAAFDNFWADRPGPGGVGLQQRYAAAWQYVARRFVDDPYVLGYDLFNEPWPANATNAELGAFYSRVIKAIRSVDTRHILFYEPYVTFNFGLQTQLPDLGAAGLGMSFHDYCLQSTLQNEGLCGQEEVTAVENALVRSQSTGDALLLSEFGASTDEQDLRRVVSVADGHQLSWIEWAFCGCDDPTGSIPPSEEALVYDPRLPATAKNVDQATLSTLVEPYPRVIAGTPISYRFDEPRHRFELTYSTQAPDRVQFPTRCSTIVVPPLQYPDGYQTSVNGGHVVSARNAGLLQVVPDPGSRAVTVTVVSGKGGHTTEPTGALSCSGA